MRPHSIWIIAPSLVTVCVFIYTNSVNDECVCVRVCVCLYGLCIDIRIFIDDFEETALDFDNCTVVDEWAGMCLYIQHFKLTYTCVCVWACGRVGVWTCGRVCIYI